MMLLTPEFANLLSAMRPEALVVLAYYAEMLHYARDLWQVRDAGAFIFGLIANHLDESWSTWLEPPRLVIHR